MFTFGRKRVEVGLGAYRDVPLAIAREKAQTYREMLQRGLDPRYPPSPTQSVESAKVPTFGEMADKFIGGKEGGWRNEKHRDQWRMTLSRRRDKKGNLTKDGYCRSLGDIAVNEVSTEDVLKVLNPIWLKKPETARRVRGRIEAVLDAAKALGHRSGENPALWRGHLSNLLPKSKKLSRGHHAAMAYGEVPALYRGVITNPTTSNLALAWTIVTAARSGETMGATLAEIDKEARLWRIPASRMKAGRDHTVPLTDAALAVLDEMHKHRGTEVELIFPGAKGGRLSVMALAMALRRATESDVTVHGFRSSFRDWCGDCTSFQRDDVELCLAHQIRDETERAYRRSDALEKRREIMKAWAEYLTIQTVGNVIPFEQRSA